MQQIRLAYIAALTAIVVTSTMDYLGHAAFSALALFPLIILFWFLAKPGRVEWGLTPGTASGYLLAVLHPLAIMLPLGLIAYMAGDVSTAEVDWGNEFKQIALIAVSTFIAAIITEEGFFRGTLWAGFTSGGYSVGQVLLVTSVAFSLWHVSWAVLPGEGQLPAMQVPVYLLNAGLIGAVWGMLRLISGSVLVASLSHGIWNALAYTLFGVAANPGALGIQNSMLFSAEVGVIAIGLNTVFLLMLWKHGKAVGKA